jgi:phage terminase large subunit
MPNPELIPENPPLTHDWVPRHYQNDALTAFNGGLRRQIHIWHRRAGKDNFGLNLARKEIEREPGNYWHLFPLQTQAKKAIWEGLDGEGRRIIDHIFPQAMRVSTLQQDMMIKFKSGSTWQMAGSDRYNSLVGSNVRGVVFSEWALCNPVSWDYIRPILRENNGWVMFITTYRGKNHAYQMYENLKDHPDWFCTKLTVNDTRREDGSPVLSAADIEADRIEGMSEALIQQEYYCSPEASHAGAYYGRAMFELNASKRRGAFGYNPRLPLYAAFDRSTPSMLACVLVQPEGNMHNVIGSRVFDNMTVQESFSELSDLYPFTKKISKAIMPPGANLENIAVPGVSFEIAPTEPLLEGIDIVRNSIPMTRIDVQIQPWAEEGNNIDFINSLQGYRAETDPKNKDMFKKLPEFVPEIYLANAFLNYCVFANRGGTDDEWSRDIDYTLHDRAAGVEQGQQMTASRGYRRAG